MPILDQLCMFFDKAVAAATATSPAVMVGAYRGRGEPLYISFAVAGANAAAVSCDVKLQESDNGTTFTDSLTVKVPKPNAQPVYETIQLPPGFKGKYARIVYTLTGTATGLTITSGVTRDHVAPYGKGQFITNGKVVA